MRLETDRLIMRPWQSDDLDDLAALCRDPLVMRFFPEPLDHARSKDLFDRLSSHFVSYGFGFWALETRDTRTFIGFTGLAHVPFISGFTPAVEIGWRLASQYHNQGYATEAARRSLLFAFQELHLDQVVSFTVPANKPSCRVMEKLGMVHDPLSDFAHPRLPPDHPLSFHVLYRLKRDDWAGRGNGV